MGNAIQLMPQYQGEKRKRRVRSEEGALFVSRRQEKEADREIRRKRRYKTKGLCYSIDEADSVLKNEERSPIVTEAPVFSEVVRGC